MPSLLRVVAALAFAAAALAQQPAPSELERRAAAGERCLVCGEFIENGQIVELRFKGRTFHVATEMLEDFLGDPDRYFYDLQSRGALFDEEGSGTGRANTLWLVFGGWVLLGLVFGAACGYVAVNRGLSPIPWFFAGLIGDVIAFVVLLLITRPSEEPAPPRLAKIPLTLAPQRCSECGAPNHPSAARCSDCAAALSPTRQSDVTRLRGGEA